MNDSDMPQMDVLYDKKLDFESVLENPVLQPILEASTSYSSLSLGIRKYLFDYQDILKRINEMVEENPIYSKTLLYMEMQSLISCVKGIIHSQDIQRNILKNTINNQVDIVSKYYIYIKTQEKPNISKEKNEVINKEELTSFESSILDEKICIPTKHIKPKGRPRKEPTNENDFVEQFCSRCKNRIGTVFIKNYDKDRLCNTCKEIRAKELLIDTGKDKEQDIKNINEKGGTNG